jgi:hypothetical protein
VRPLGTTITSIPLHSCAAARELIDWEAYQRADANGRQALRDQAMKWLKANAGRTHTDLLLDNLRTSKDPKVVLAAAQELTRKKEAAALTNIFLRIAELPKPEDRAALAECCFRLAPERCLEQARQWLAQDGEIRFWAALILFSSGDWSKQEGWTELKEALATDGEELKAHKRAFDTLLNSRRPEALDLAAGVFKHSPKDANEYETQPFIQRLFLAGRHEALDYLLAALDDETSAGTTSTVVNGKRVSVELTRGDRIAEHLHYLRKDDYEYPFTASEAERAAERAKLKHWLTEQMDLIRNGKESGFRTNTAEFSFPNWALDAP